LTEIETLKTIDDLLSALADQEARKRVLTWALGKFLPQIVPIGEQQIPSGATIKRQIKNRGKKSNAQATPTSLIKDLNLKPKGKQSLDAFVQTKDPRSLYEKCTLAVHYLRTELSTSNVSASHVYTCFKHMHWKLPTNLGNTLSYTASHYGWLDTSNMQDIRLTAIGENLIEHDLPKASKKKS